MIVVIGLIVAFVLVAIFANRETRDCRWREYRTGDGRAEWRCAFCGAVTEGTQGETPQRCYRPEDS